MVFAASACNQTGFYEIERGEIDLEPFCSRRNP